jgi:hypothetical protein
MVDSSLLSVTHLPAVIFSAPCAFHEGQEDEVRQRISYPKDNDQLVRFILRGAKLLTFHNLHDPNGPFSGMIDHRAVEDLPISKVWSDPEGTRRYVNLLNRAMFKYTSNLGIRYDPGHRRFFFPAEESGEERAVEYRPLNANKTTRKVAWQPKRKSSGEKRKFWWHLAAGLRFLHVSDKQWCLSIRPERHLTSDGVVPLPPKQIGRRVTSMKSKMRNLNYLTEVNFWRDFLSRGTPRLVLNFGDQSAIINAEFLSFGIEWPGVPNDDEPFKNVSYQDDLFTKAEFDHARDGEPLAWEEDKGPGRTIDYRRWNWRSPGHRLTFWASQTFFFQAANNIAIRRRGFHSTALGPWELSGINEKYTSDSSVRPRRWTMPSSSTRSAARGSPVMTITRRFLGARAI